jgi:hypothetical protein
VWGCNHELIAHLDFAGVEFPLLLAVKSRDINTSGDEAVPAAQGNGLQGPLDSIKDGCQKTRPKLHRKGL